MRLKLVDKLVEACWHLKRMRAEAVLQLHLRKCRLPVRNLVKLEAQRNVNGEIRKDVQAACVGL